MRIFNCLTSSVTVALWLMLCGGSTQLVQAQAPGLLWNTSLNATLFAVDAQTNVYANANGSVIVLNSAGVPVLTNAVCPLPGLARRDAAGNYYFAGNFDGTQNFGGITLVGGWTNWPNPGQWTPNWPTCFLTKYNSNGVLQWAKSFGLQSYSNQLGDFCISPAGDFYVSYMASGLGKLARFNAVGGALGENDLDSFPGSTRTIKLGGVSNSNVWFQPFPYDMDVPHPNGGTLGLAGNLNWFAEPLRPGTVAGANGHPLIDHLGRGHLVGRPISGNTRILRCYSPALAEVSSVAVTSAAEWTLARDAQSFLYLAGTSGLLAKFNVEGTLIWSNYFGSACVVMVVDSSDNRFVSFQNGSVGRLASDQVPEPPSVLQAPQSQTVFVGDQTSLSVTAAGTPPLRYLWRRAGVPVAGETNATLLLAPAQTNHAGNYDVIITNAAGAITSPPALLRVKSVQFYLGNQMLTNGTYVFTTNPTITVRSTFAGGSAFYTLNGTVPSFGSTYYSGPVTLAQSATLRAIGYSADFMLSEEADSVIAVVAVNRTLTATATGGGSVNLTPLGGTYLSGENVTVTAQPSPGWSFLYWLGDATGTNPVQNISMTSDKVLHAVFGTTLATTVAGSGQVVLSPPGGLYPFGSTVRLTGVPAPGNYFGFWGNAATGDTNPLYFTVTAPTQTVSSIFGATPVGQAALTVLPNGGGYVTVNPRANTYPLNQQVTLTAVPKSGQTFISWTGDASGSANPLVVTMNQARIITANFTSRPSLQINQSGLDGFRNGGFRFTLSGDWPSVWQIFGSTNFQSWENLGLLTNDFGQIQFTDPDAALLNQRYYRAEPAP